jgi:hypothetical protein
MKEENEVYFVYDYDRSFCYAVATIILCSGWLAIEIKHGDLKWSLVAAAVIAYAAVKAWVSGKWVFRRWIGWWR